MMLYRAGDVNIEALIRQAPLIPAGRGKRARCYIDLVSAFDIETSRINVDGEDNSIMYVWQWAIENDVIIGRTWESFLDIVTRISNTAGAAYLIVYVHNLSYEFSFLKGIYNFSPDDVFCTDKRKILKCDMMHIEFRCSYLHSNLSLSAWLKEVKAPHRKLSGKRFDYNIVRYPWTPLTYREMQYCINDVRGVVDAIHIEMNRDNDTLKTIPLTKTGYVRRVVKKALHDNTNYSMMHDIQPDYELYKALREAFRGGDTHASRFYSGHIVDNVHHVDRSSSYPDVMCNCKFPMSKFIRVENADMIDLLSAINHEKAVLVRLSINNLRLKSAWRFGCPYIPVAKCRMLSSNRCEDNGRIIYAEYAEITLTDIDLKIVLNQYEGDVNILDMWSCRYAMLPQSVRDVIIDLYHKKTSLKGVHEQELIYNLSKSMINACYGMAAQDPGKPVVKYMSGDERQYVYDVEKQQAELVKEAAKKNFLPYQIGVWVTALARYELHEAINIVDDTDGAEFLYCDTDSIFYTGAVSWDGYNDMRQKRAIANGAWAKDRKDKPHYMGVMEFEPDCRRFATLGAKKYAYQDMDGTLHITIAGVVKDIGARELDKLGGLQKFVDMDNPPVFVEAGGSEILYNDMISRDIMLCGRKYHLTDNAVIRPSTYTLGLDSHYARLLNKIENNIDLIAFMGDLV